MINNIILHFFKHVDYDIGNKNRVIFFRLKIMLMELGAKFPCSLGEIAGKLG